MPSVQCLQHEVFEGMAAINDWLIAHKCEIHYTRFYESYVLPDIEAIDMVIIMGGPMSVNDEQLYPWLIAEKEFIRKCMHAGKVVLGICLGAQLIANALGASVYPNTKKEIGWFPIFKNKQENSPLLADLPVEITVFHWHGETFDLPLGARLLASSEACRNQVFSIGDKIFGFQCHLEINAAALHGFVDEFDNEIVPSKFIQTEQEMLKLEKIYSKEMNQVLFSLLSKLTK